MFLACSPRKPRMSVTLASNGSPLSLTQSLMGCPLRAGAATGANRLGLGGGKKGMSGELIGGSPRGEILN